MLGPMSCREQVETLAVEHTRVPIVDVSEPSRAACDDLSQPQSGGSIGRRARINGRVHAPRTGLLRLPTPATSTVTT